MMGPFSPELQGKSSIGQEPRPEPSRSGALGHLDIPSVPGGTMTVAVTDRIHPFVASEQTGRPAFKVADLSLAELGC